MHTFFPSNATVSTSTSSPCQHPRHGHINYSLITATASMVCSIVDCCLISSVFCVLPCVPLNMLDICVFLCVLIVVCAARYTRYLCVALCAHCCMRYLICWIFSVLLYFNVLPCWPMHPQFMLHWSWGKLGTVMLLDLANRQLNMLHPSRSVHPKNKDHNIMKQNASALVGQALHFVTSWAAQHSPN